MPDPKALADKARRLAALELRRQAALNEFSAAALTNDQKEMARLRDNLHTFLDASLDMTAEILREGQL
jgi:hypothetical protein